MIDASDTDLKPTRCDFVPTESASWQVDATGTDDELGAAKGIGFAIMLGTLLWVGLVRLLVVFLG